MASDIANTWLVAESVSPSGTLNKSWRPLAVGLLIGAVLGTSLTAAVESGWAREAHRAAKPAAVAREWPDRPIPAEWRWERKPITFDHMFRKPR